MWGWWCSSSENPVGGGTLWSIRWLNDLACSFMESSGSIRMSMAVRSPMPHSPSRNRRGRSGCRWLSGRSCRTPFGEGRPEALLRRGVDSEPLGEVPLERAELLSHLVERRLEVLTLDAGHRLEQLGISARGSELIEDGLQRRKQVVVGEQVILHHVVLGHA